MRARGGGRRDAPSDDPRGSSRRDAPPRPRGSGARAPSRLFFSATPSEYPRGTPRRGRDPPATTAPLDPGAHGTRGAFTAAAVDTATELRAHSGQLTTILDVLIHDPLYKWMLSPRDAQRKQRDDDDDERPGGGDDAADNQAAARALLVVKQKLQGYSDATHDVLSVEGQVTQLIAEATDRDNLCVLFAGWAPWL